jgi:hypothetical protein
VRSSRIAVLTVVTLGAGGSSGCGGDAPGMRTGDDRADVLRVTRAYAAADARNDRRALCALLTTARQREYISDFADDAAGPRDLVACTAAVKRIQRRFGERDARYRRVAERVSEAAKDDARVEVMFEDGHADVHVDAAKDDQDDGYFRLEREDGRWRMGTYPETATLR